VGVKRSATDLVARDHNIPTRAVKQAYRGQIRFAEHCAHHTAADQANASPRWTEGRRELRQRDVAYVLGQQRKHITREFWKKLLQAETANGPSGQERKPQAFWKGQNLFNGDAAKKSLSEGAAMVLLDVSACVFKQAAILHTARASGLARTAPEAEVDVAHNLRSQLNPAGIQGAHEIDAATRRIVFVAGLEVSRT
jgi:hypothetical protein